MNNRTRLRNAGIALFVVVFVLALVTVQLPATPLFAQAVVTITPTTATATLSPGGSTSVVYQVTNNTDDARTFSASFGGVPSGFNIVQQSQVLIAARSSASFTILVSSSNAQQAPGSYPSVAVTFTGTPASGTATAGSATLNLIISGSTFTPTPSQTGTSAPPTSTPTQGPVCNDGFEPDNGPGSARTIDVQTTQQHAICPAGDEDWLLFGGVSGKTYTIDITRMDAGIDLSLELFDSELRSIAFNDDFFNRDPAAPDAGDIRPRITIRIPADGRYYVRVRDNAGRGGTNYIYVVALVDESYGPTPTQVTSVCQDLFEPDGLPEQADLITSNELQEDRKLCPAGDADWVTFFGKAGKRYVMFTDSRRYRGRNTVNGETQAGADTVIVLTDRDGVSLLDVNDDIPGGNTLDSQVEFIPEVDGFYFLQIKNVGDIGNQFIRYDLILLLCLPGQTDCGRASAPPPTTGPAAPSTQSTPTATPSEEFQLDPTPTTQAGRPNAPAALLPLRPAAVQPDRAPHAMALVSRNGS